jgi:hypothetical protein
MFTPGVGWGELWTRLFVCRPCLITGEPVGLAVYPPIVRRIQLSKYVPEATRIVGGVVSSEVRVVSKRSRRLALPELEFVITKTAAAALTAVMPAAYLSLTSRMDGTGQTVGLLSVGTEAPLVAIARSF